MAGLFATAAFALTPESCDGGAPNKELDSVPMITVPAGPFEGTQSPRGELMNGHSAPCMSMPSS